MSEVMQILHPENTTPTCIKHNGRSTIDHIFVTEDLKARVISCEIKPYVYSDHQAKIMEMATLKTVAADRKTSTYWKQNINSLEEIEYKENIKNLIKTQQKKFKNKIEWWTELKEKKTKITKKYERRRAEEKKTTETLSKKY